MPASGSPKGKKAAKAGRKGSGGSSSVKAAPARPKPQRTTAKAKATQHSKGQTAKDAPATPPKKLHRPGAIAVSPLGLVNNDRPMKPTPSMRCKEADRVTHPTTEPTLLNEEGSPARKVLILYTGGTLGMQDRGDGTLGPVPGGLSKSLQGLSELKQRRMPRCYFCEFDPILDSADMAPKDWTSIARAVHDWYFEFDGFVVLHGTDTMAYTASALSFMLEQLAKPVILTGAQLPIFEPISDARQNFLGAVAFAGLADISEVCLFFNGNLYRGNRAIKASASALAAFESPSYPPLAELGVPIHVYRQRLQQPPNGRFRLQEIHVTDILVVWVIPGFSDDFFQPLLKSKSLRGMVLLLYGCGNAPARKQKFLGLLKQLVDTGVVVVACSQCTHGSVILEKYSVGKAFQSVGVIGGHDMTTEAAVTKLAYLLSKGLTAGEVRRAMVENLRGEMTTEATAFTISEPVTGVTSI